MEPGTSTPGGARGLPRTAAGIGDDADGELAASPEIEVILGDPAWRRILPRAEALARRAACAALREAGSQAGGVTVLLASDRALRRLNGEHRGQDKPTNVLSFPGAGGGHLGDIALALGVVRREAAASGKRPAAHFAHLVAHGTLHLLGYDHGNAGEAGRMERAESRALHRLRLPNPWANPRRAP
jgi:probable rRNA maturation factor